MFEFSVALRYLLPRQRQLSVSIITLLSIFVISCIVWLMLVFFSVTTGLEARWVSKLVSMTAPIRVVPEQAYYDSYYYRIDEISEASGYSHKSLSEKLNSDVLDPYDPSYDMEPSVYWPVQQLNAKGEPADLVKDSHDIMINTSGVKMVDDYDHAVALLKLHIIREGSADKHTQRYISQTCYLSSWNSSNATDENFIMEVSAQDRDNLLSRSEGDIKGIGPFSELLPRNDILGDAILLPKHFRNSSVLIGDRGYLSYQMFGAGALQEQRLPVYVVGFYDPGIIPLGGKFVVVNKDVVSLVNSENEVRDSFLGSGFNIWVDDIKDVQLIKSELQAALDAKDLGSYWKIETYREYEFTRDLLQQLQSERNLFTLIAIIIIMVACSNIVSMLILLVNDKRREIGVLQAMGARKRSIAAIFALCGFSIGFISSVIGTGLALITLSKLNVIINFLSRLQGHALFNPTFYGDLLPNNLNGTVLVYVFIATAFISTVAGLIPAIKACLLSPAKTLRSE